MPLWVLLSRSPSHKGCVSTCLNRTQQNFYFLGARLGIKIVNCFGLKSVGVLRIIVACFGMLTCFLFCLFLSFKRIGIVQYMKILTRFCDKLPNLFGFLFFELRMYLVPFARKTLAATYCVRSCGTLCRSAKYSAECVVLKGIHGTRHNVLMFVYKHKSMCSSVVCTCVSEKGRRKSASNPNKKTNTDRQTGARAQRVSDSLTRNLAANSWRKSFLV